MKIRVIVLFALMSLTVSLSGQQRKTSQNEIYIDSKGLIRLQENAAEASFFGVNYTLPFAYGYRSHKKLIIDIEKAIDQDVYHLARLGINAFRVHVWDTEISDTAGNLLQNEHLRLLDYLLSKLEERQIRIIITPIAYWGNGYPDQDEKTGSFSEKFGKEGAVIKEEAFKAQERYLTQFFKHVNPYTKKTYGQDRFVIATEINNEPHHGGPKSLATSYVNRMVAAIKGTGWNKPVFYNISESPAYADAVAKSKVNGFSFQWYPTGLVAGHELSGNLLPNVDKYVIPFDTIPEFKNKARMIYEFDAADVLKSYMYPAMARSFKTAGFQWATQFAYDPMGTAYANTEYQTHYLNLAYTPAKAISLLIAAKVFKEVPLYKSYGSFPADTTFGPFTVSYKRQLSEMNAPSEFYYSNHTRSVPVKISALQHLAGVGSSEVVNYKGTGAYFIDKLSNESWRLEVMPDAIAVHDPFGKNSLEAAVMRIVFGKHEMKISLPEIGGDFKIEPLNAGNSYRATAVGGRFEIQPGTYVLLKKGSINKLPSNTKLGIIGLNEFVAPARISSLSKEDPFSIANNPDSAQHLFLFNPAVDRELAIVYSPDWKTDPYEYVTAANGEPLLKMDHKAGEKSILGGLEVFVKKSMNSLAKVTTGNSGRTIKNSFKSISIRAVASVDLPVKIILINGDAVAYSCMVNVGKEMKAISVPLSSFKRDDYILLPRPYPGFQSMVFSNVQSQELRVEEIEKVQILLKGDTNTTFSIQIGKICLEDFFK